jgi:hypothetical protein
MYNTKQASMVNNSSQMLTAQEVNMVYKTYDLSVFRSIEGNRIPNIKHIRSLTESIKQHGMKCNPIIVNEKYQVIDGQHRLAAAKNAGTFVYFIIIEGYNLLEVHTLNLNQKNWTRTDYMNGYAEMGIDSYVKLKQFTDRNPDFKLSDCIALCSNITTSANTSLSHKFKKNGVINIKEVFQEGTWKGKDFNLAQQWANNIRMIKPYYDGYNRTVFVGTIIMLLQNKNFDINEFVHKLSIQPNAMNHCTNRAQFKDLIEDIYNYRSRNKVSFKY